PHLRARRSPNAPCAAFRRMPVKYDIIRGRTRRAAHPTALSGSTFIGVGMQFRLGSLIGRTTTTFLFPRTFAVPRFRRAASDNLPAVASRRMKEDGRCLEPLPFTPPATRTHPAPPLLETAAMACHQRRDPFEGAIFHPARMLRPLTSDEKTVVERLLKFRLVESRLQAIFIVVYVAKAGFDPDSIAQAQQIAMWSGSELAPV